MTLSIAEQLCRASVKKMEPYIVEPRESNGAIYLDANENPYVKTIDFPIAVNRYPEPQPEILRREYAQYLGIDTEEVLVTLGGDSGIELLIKTFCEAGKDQLLYCPPTFGMYQVTCDLYDIKTVQIPLNDDFSLNTEALINEIDNVKMIFLCSPNNPTGNTIPSTEIERILEATRDRAIVVLDEAYIEFSEEKSWAQRVKKYPHLAIIRTLSKAFGLAGLRCGFVVADQSLITVLRRTIAPYPIPVPVIAMAENVLTKEGIWQMQQERKLLLQERVKFTDNLKQFSFVEKIFPSDSNFVLIKVQNSQKLAQYLKDNAVFVRLQSAKELQNCIRISMGLPEEMEKVTALLAKYTG